MAVNKEMALKEMALARTAPTVQHTKRYHTPDSLLAFLQDL